MKTIAELLNHDFKQGSLYLYDSNGKEIYYENSNGYWHKLEYDSNGNQIYYEDSNGFWFKSEYDSNGNQIYFEESNGYIKDNRPNPSCDGKIVEIEGTEMKAEEKAKQLVDKMYYKLQPDELGKDQESAQECALIADVH
jgi:hypothetical protein